MRGEAFVLLLVGTRRCRWNSLVPANCWFIVVSRMPKIAAQIRSLADQAGLGIDRLAVDIGPAQSAALRRSNDRRSDRSRCHRRNTRRIIRCRKLSESYVPRVVRLSATGPETPTR